MSHSNPSFGGVLSPLVELLEKKPRQAGRLAGQDVVIGGVAEVSAIIALDSDENIHLLISRADGDDARLTRLDLKGLKVEKHEWSVSGHAAQTYLDLSCATGILPAFRRPFLRFAEDVLYELSQNSTNPADAVYRTGKKWKHFWSDGVLAEVTATWIHGLAGELSFLSALIERHGPSVLGSWTGPLGKDHDFQTGTDLAVEVKASAEMPFAIRCNIRQLDTAIFKKLYIACYRITSAENGVSLPVLVQNIENLIDDGENLDTFRQKLVSAGYSPQSEQAYLQHPMVISTPAIFTVDDLFPKVAESSFVTPPDHRISDIKYTVQLTGLDELNLDDISPELASFKS